MNFDIDVASVHFVNAEKYTVDMVGMSGNRYKEIPFLSLYSKPLSNGQGLYMLPEIGSYALVIKLKHGGGKFGSDKFAFGFFNPIDSDGSYIGERETLQSGEFCVKTAAGNKIICRADGTVTAFASDQAQMTLFPASGNRNDSCGFDNLLQLLLENLDVTTDGGYFKHTVNKKDKTSNLEFEIRNKPLYSENPGVVRGNIGYQLPTGDPQYFMTLEVFDCKEGGEKLIPRSKLEWKIDGWRCQTKFDVDGYKVSSFLINEKNETSNEYYDVVNQTSVLKHCYRYFANGEVFRSSFDTASGSSIEVFTEKILNDGSVTRITYDIQNNKMHEVILGKDGSMMEKVYSSEKTIYEKTRQNNGDILESINDANGQPTIIQDLRSTGGVTISIKNAGANKIQIQMSKDGDLSLSVEGDLTATIKGDANITATGNAIVTGTKVLIGGASGLPTEAILTANCTFKHICPMIGAMVPTLPVAAGGITGQSKKVFSS